MLISPWIPKGSVFQEPKGPYNSSQFELTSICSTAKTLFNLTGFLTKRDAWAGSFDELLTLSEPRDTPLHLPDAPKPAVPFPPNQGWPPPPPAEAKGSAELRRLEAHAGGPMPRHCSAGGQCAEAGAATQKQRNTIRQFAAAANQPVPTNLEQMTQAEAEEWITRTWPLVASGDAPLKSDDQSSGTRRRRLGSCTHALRDACEAAVVEGRACGVCTGVTADGAPVLPPEGCARKDVREFCADQPGGVNGAAARNVTMETTFYGARDNCPPGGAIAWPLLHQVAGGTGTFADPITFAGAHKSIPKHTRVYVQVLWKYFIMEDSCEECEHDWSHKQKYHIDLWMGTDKLGEGAPLIACENAMTRSHSTVTIDPPQGERKPDSVNSSSHYV